MYNKIVGLYYYYYLIIIIIIIVPIIIIIIYYYYFINFIFFSLVIYCILDIQYFYAHLSPHEIPSASFPCYLGPGGKW